MNFGGTERKLYRETLKDKVSNKELQQTNISGLHQGPPSSLEHCKYTDACISVRLNSHDDILQSNHLPETKH